MSDLEGQYFNRILELEAERDALKAELERLSGKTQFCVQCERYARENEKLRETIKLASEAIYSVYDPYRDDCPLCNNFLVPCKESCPFPKAHKALETFRKVDS